MKRNICLISLQLNIEIVFLKFYFTKKHLAINSKLAQFSMILKNITYFAVTKVYSSNSSTPQHLFMHSHTFEHNNQHLTKILVSFDIHIETKITNITFSHTVT